MGRQRAPERRVFLEGPDVDVQALRESLEREARHEHRLADELELRSGVRVHRRAHDVVDLVARVTLLVCALGQARIHADLLQLGAVGHVFGVVGVRGEGVRLHADLDEDGRRHPLGSLSLLGI